MEERKVDYYSARLNKNNLEDFPIILGEKFYGSVYYIGSFFVEETLDIYMITIEESKAVVRKCFQSISTSQSYSSKNENGIDLTTTIYASEKIEKIPSEQLNILVQNKVNLNLDSAFNCVQIMDNNSFEFLNDLQKKNPSMDIQGALLIYNKTKQKKYEYAI